MEYHYGKTIREYRMQRGLTLSQLAEQWPSKETGVTSRYVSDIERGIKHIGDTEVLRKLASILDVPLWKFGLSEYNPFQDGTGYAPVKFDSEAIEESLQNLWLVRQIISLNIFSDKVHKFSILFDKQLKYDASIKTNKDFLRLYAHRKRLEEAVYTEMHDYRMSLKCAYDMLALANSSGDSIAQAIAYTRIGVELLRDENRVAMEYLQQACDISLCLSKEVRAYCYEFLARGYMIFGEYRQFERAINTAITFGECMQGQPVITKDYVFHAFSAILAEKSDGFIQFGQSSQVLAMLPEIEKQCSLENNNYLKMWIPLDYAQGYMLQGEIEESISQLYMFYDRIKSYNSKRIYRKVEKHLNELDALGYGMLPVVQDFKKMLLDR